MKLRGRILMLLLASGAAASIVGQGLPSGFPEEEVLVIVWRGADRCSVLDRKTNCSRVASLLTGRLQIPRDRGIVVAIDGNDQEVGIRAAQVMTDIRAAGYRRVRQADTAGRIGQ